MMVDAATDEAGPMLPATSVPALAAKVTVAVTPSLQLVTSKS